MLKKMNWVQLLTLILVTQILGLLSSLLSGPSGQIYSVLNKPALAPPGWLFGVIWPILYLLMGIAVYMIYQKPQAALSKKAIQLYWIQILINVLWPIVFFRFKWYVGAISIIILLDIWVAATMICFFKVKKTAGYLMIPYFIWILFATYLNIGIALLN